MEAMDWIKRSLWHLWIVSKIIMIYYVITIAVVICLGIVQNTYGETNNTETNTTRSFRNCYTGTMATFFYKSPLLHLK